MAAGNCTRTRCRALYSCAGSVAAANVGVTSGPGAGFARGVVSSTSTVSARVTPP